MPNILVINRSKTRKPDFWMLCKEEFTEDEVRPYLGIMRRNRIRFLPAGVNCRWEKLRTKDELLQRLDTSKKIEKLKREALRRLKTAA